MEILLDTAHVETIRKYSSIYNLTGVTTNPTILAREKAEFFPLLQEIRGIIGDGQLHVQVTGNTCEEMMKEAEAVTDRLGKETYIKVPANEEGLKTMKALKSRGFLVTATAIYMPQQAMLASVAGADYVAPYFNRMNNMNVDGRQAVQDIATLFRHFGRRTKILAASFHNTYQIMEALMAGADTVTASADMFTTMVENPSVDGAIADFRRDWTDTYGDRRIYEL
ncbi:MAG TPA: fructose-6-phosphate aldolase [Candidatus Scatomonas merdavium]|nr:fructose-6-phosphate aldolase [Candidatus Scatomonas merdavium]